MTSSHTDKPFRQGLGQSAEWPVLVAERGPYFEGVFLFDCCPNALAVLLMSRSTLVGIALLVALVVGLKLCWIWKRKTGRTMHAQDTLRDWHWQDPSSF
mmetsp:Transcript_88996/g.285368  ORF Transcript_88996/g.285368 Transcript_88996/m.285368 type:complete len:99 (-) Transcript_88996:127-423(-)